MKPKLSIIIPCYNSELTLERTLHSVMGQEFSNWEVILINDGSFDSTEEISLAWLKTDDRIKYFSKTNEGLGKARNYGISKSKGDYILPLDSDNLVEKKFAAEAIRILDKNNSIGVVHGNAEYFGDRQGEWVIDEFNLDKLLCGNYIDACAIYRKSLWAKCGGYDEAMPYQGNEDWAFWISLGSINTRFFHLDRITFKYFVSEKSMIRSFSDDMHLANRDYIASRFSELIYDRFASLLTQNERLKEDSMYLKNKYELFQEIWCRTKRKLRCR